MSVGIAQNALLHEFGGFQRLLFLLDDNAFAMFGRTIAQRVDLFVRNLFAASLIYWIVGSCYTFYVFSCMSVLQEDIANPNYNLFHEIMKCPVHKHVCCILGCWYPWELDCDADTFTHQISYLVIPS